MFLSYTHYVLKLRDEQLSVEMFLCVANAGVYLYEFKQTSIVQTEVTGINIEISKKILCEGDSRTRLKL